MKILYSDQEFELLTYNSIFLAGPTPRSTDVKSWRPEAINILKNLGFDGLVYVPEPEGSFKHSYLDQIDWEESGLIAATCIAFWVPRDIKNGMPAFTTNDEWGSWKRSGKVVWGSPPNADKTKYQLHYAKKLNVPISNTLKRTMENAVDKVKQLTYKRASGECICDICGEPYYKHIPDMNMLDSDNHPYLNILCDRTRVKL